MADKESLDYTSRSSWNDFQISAPNGRMIEGMYINMSRVDEPHRKELRKRLNALGVRTNRRLAKNETERAAKGDYILSVLHPADVEKLSLLFTDAPHPRRDWRNLRNWDYRDFTYKGKNIPGYCFSVQNMTLANLERIGSVLVDLGLCFDLSSADRTTRHIRLGETYLRVVGDESVKQLKEFASHWTLVPPRPRNRGRS